MKTHYNNEGFFREIGSLVLTLLFEVLFVGTAILESGGMAFHRLHTYVDEHMYYHTEEVSIVGKLMFYMAIFIALQCILIYFSYKNGLAFSKILCPLFMICTVGVVLHIYAGIGGTKYFVLLIMGLVVMVLFTFLGTFSLSVESCEVLSWFMIGLTLFNMVYGCMYQINGSGAWIHLFGLSVQLGEVAKIFIVIYLSYAYTYIRDNKKVRHLFIVTIILQILTLVIVRDLGNALILLFLCMFVILPFYSVKIALVGILDVVLGLYALCAGVQIFKEHIGTSYLVRRFANVFHIFEKAEETQYRKVLYGVLRGGMQGTGLKDGVYTYSTTAYAATSDYAFLTVMAIFSVGIALVVLFSIGLIVLNANLPMKRHWDLSRFCVGKVVASVLVIQVLMHVAGGLNIWPFTGVTFPFLSAGGSAICTNFAIIGIILSSQLPYQKVQRIQGKIKKIHLWWEKKRHEKSIC